jgi:hypothetical protein
MAPTADYIDQEKEYKDKKNKFFVGCMNWRQLG